jgi:parallel beta-helix repeat protein
MPNYAISFTASSTLIGSLGAHVNVLVDGKKIGSTYVGSTTKTYTFNTTLTSGVAHDIRLAYDNDAARNGQDRNLTVDSIAVNGHKMLAINKYEVYHAVGQGNLHSTGDMKWNGNAEFKVPASMFGGKAAATVKASPAAGIYVSASGSDSANGSAAHPFKTLARAVQAMESSGIHTTYVEGGTYKLDSTLTLTSADSGMTIAAAPGAKPIITGGGSLQTLVQMNGATGVTLRGLELRGASGQALIIDGGGNNKIMGNMFADNGEGMLLRDSTSRNVISGNVVYNSRTSGIEMQDGASGNKIVNNVVNKTGAVETHGAGIYGHGTNDNMIANNLVENTAGVGIGIENWDAHTISVGNSIIHNVVKNANSSALTHDSGAIYMLGRSNVNTHSVIAGNYISGPTTSPNGSGAHIVGIYLDDNTSGVKITNNIVADIVTHGVQIHGGNDVTVSNNIFNLGSSSSASAILFQDRASDVGGATMQNNVVTHNIVTSTSSSPVAFTNISAGNPTISSNFYMDLINSHFQTDGLGQTGAKYGNAMFADQGAGNYSLGSNSGAHAIGFTGISEKNMGPHPVNAHWFGNLGHMTS